MRNVGVTNVKFRLNFYTLECVEVVDLFMTIGRTLNVGMWTNIFRKYKEYCPCVFLPYTRQNMTIGKKFTDFLVSARLVPTVLMVFLHAMFY